MTVAGRLSLWKFTTGTAPALLATSAGGTGTGSDAECTDFSAARLTNSACAARCCGIVRDTCPTAPVGRRRCERWRVARAACSSKGRRHLLLVAEGTCLRCPPCRVPRISQLRPPVGTNRDRASAFRRNSYFDALFGLRRARRQAHRASALSAPCWSAWVPWAVLCGRYR